MQNQKQIAIDLTKIKNVRCECGKTIFERIYVIKKVPGLMVGSAQDIMSPVEVYRCYDCKTIHPDFEKAISEPVDLKIS